MSTPTCNSSGVLSTSTVVAKHHAKIMSVHATSTANALFTVKIWDSDSASVSGKKEVARLELHAGGTAQTIEQDLHGVLVANGIYAQIATGTGTVSVNFA
tara:strand:+ start:601 stop:900 length:300 start_codon:yes stop_codon:yes gene_type:complete